MTSPLRSPRTLTAAVFDRLRSDILDGHHRPGAPLKQDVLAELYGVSRIPVREALFQLEAEGLVRIVPHKGAIVTSVSPAEIADVFELRAMLEPRLLERSAPLLNADDYDRLESIQAEFESAVQRHDTARWGALNADLHMVLYARAPLPRSLSIVTGLLQTSERYTRIHLSAGSGWERARSEHAEIVALCRAGQVPAACALLYTHIDLVRIDLVGLIGDTVSDSA